MALALGPFFFLRSETQYSHAKKTIDLFEEFYRFKEKEGERAPIVSTEKGPDQWGLSPERVKIPC